MSPCDFENADYDIFAHEIGFNPCFSGCRPAMEHTGQQLRHWWSFNPCFSGCRPAIIDSKTCDKCRACFNPCFSGCRPAIKDIAENTIPSSSFNPCFSGCRPAIVLIVSFIRPVFVSILVLVDVALRLEPVEIEKYERKSFNPCFSGCRPAIVCASDSKANCWEFQSLF